MKKIVIVLAIVFLVMSCTNFVTVTGKVIDKMIIPPSGGLFYQPEKMCTIIKTDNGLMKIVGFEIYYSVQIDDQIEYTYDRTRNSGKTTYRVIGE